MSPFVASLRDLLQERHVADWCSTGYRLVHEPSGLTLWIANGRMFLEASGEVHYRFSFWERWALWPLVRRMGSLVAARSLTKSLAPKQEMYR